METALAVAIGVAAGARLWRLLRSPLGTASPTIFIFLAYLAWTKRGQLPVLVTHVLHVAVAALVGARLPVVGLTGGIGSGKSRVSVTLKRLGAVVVDMDLIAREVVLPGQPAYKDIVRAFGEGVLLPAPAPGLPRALDRASLRRRIATDDRARKALNKATHKRILASALQQVAYHGWLHGRTVVIDAPLLFESGFALQLLCCPIICVAAPPDTQLSRVLARDGPGGAGADTTVGLLRAQMPLLDKARRTDVLIDNGPHTSLEELEAMVEHVWGLVGRGGWGRWGWGAGQARGGVAVGSKRAEALAEAMLRDSEEAVFSGSGDQASGKED